ncbi:MAG: (2Fe-2S)-binding protein [Clostridiales bacterium]|nr:(2Fe-2S)-binding protein [Clostridiales bacterium]
MDERTIICRCSDVTLKEVRDLINEGYTEPNEIKKILRTGMGPCQGRTCGPLIIREVARMTGRTIEEVTAFTFRPPSKGIKMNAISKGGELDD